jgi:ribA/ribD-fused uncharacterized protein
MMAQKALLFGDTESFKKILESTNAREMKQLGQKVRNFDQQTWDQHKYDIVKRGNLLKFGQNAEILKNLKETGTKILVEASPFDRIWGIGFTEKEAIANIHKWGQNLLGKALMDVRSELS